MILISDADMSWAEVTDASLCVFGFNTLTVEEDIHAYIKGHLYSLYNFP